MKLSSTLCSTFKKADILVIRFGFADRYQHAPKEKREALAEHMTSAGLAQSEDVLKWIWEQQFSAMASDAPALEMTRELYLEHMFCAAPLSRLEKELTPFNQWQPERQKRIQMHMVCFCTQSCLAAGACRLVGLAYAPCDLGPALVY